jgi:anaerobic sulfite reductase subunit B
MKKKIIRQKLKKAEKKASNPYMPKPYKVLESFRESTDTFTITVDMKVKHDPGQFVQVSIPGVGECPISICSYSDKFLKLNIREVGNVTKALSKIKKGDKLLIRGPYGHGYPMTELKGNDLIIIGGGCGVAPLKGIIDYVEKNRSDYKDVMLFLGYRSPNDIIFTRELTEWRKKYNLDVTVDQNAHSEFCYDAKTGFVTDALKAANINNQNKVVFICGPPVMMKFVIDILKQKGFHDDQIFISAERLMFCALGVCCHCMIHGKFTCIDGPVFRYDEIVKYKND